MSRFFIDRPVFAWVVAILIMLAGVLSVFRLPVNHYPDVAAPAIAITVTYPGASAQTVQDTVVQVIEQQLNGLDGLRYISSTSSSDGSMNITVTFDQGTNPDIAQVQVQNKLQLATPLLPEEVQRQGIRVAKFSVNFMMVAVLVSEDGRWDDTDLGNYVGSYLQDPIVRTKGVGDFTVFGSPYAMRIWLDPAKLYNFNLTPSDVISAVEQQNVQVSMGQLGGLPTAKGVQLNATIVGKVRMKTAEEFNEILVKVNADGSQVRLKDIAEVGLGSQNFSVAGKFDGKPAAGLAIRLATGANTLETAAAVHKTISNLESFLPAGVKIYYPYETAPKVTASIEAIIHTLIEAIALVFIVMFVFLQNFRATIIPTIAVPVVMLGTMAVLYAFGYSINLITMFAMVLAIGLLVDDAIVVVENVERLMTEEGLSPKEAARKSMDQIQGALISIGLVISAVFLPMAFISGSTGVIYRQFSITIVAAMAFSVLVAIFFTPMLCATLLKANHGSGHVWAPFAWFNRVFERGSNGYQGVVKTTLKRRSMVFVIYLAIVGGLGLLLTKLPSGFLPDEDQGVMMIQVTLPPNSSAERTEAVLAQVREHLMTKEGDMVKTVFTVRGFNFAGNGQNSGIAFIEFFDFADRKEASKKVQALGIRAFEDFKKIKDATIIPIIPPSIIELGNSSGFDIFLQDQAGLGHEVLMEARNKFLQLASQDSKLALVRPNGLDDEPQYEIVIDEERARAQQVSLAEVNQTMSVAWGSAYVNDFIDRGRVKKVYIQGINSSRIAPEDFNKWFVRSNSGQMVPFSAIATGRWIYGSPKLERFNGVPSVEVVGQPAPGVSTGEALASVERIMREMPAGIGLAYTGLSYEEGEAGSQTTLLFLLSALVVFLCLSALYESWSIPVAVMMVVPLGIIGAVAATLLRGISADVFFQVGLLTTMGLAAKNAILIVEFAKELRDNHGKTAVEAAIEAARLRLRPIIMTSIAFLFGVLPMALANGPSSGSQQSIGTGVVGGMLTATFLAIFFVPLFYVLVVEGIKRKKTPAQEQRD
ncbi:efflux RND transporter permease subunit [Methylobacillus pratensis]|uniref:efflux RND transporter permease subunit n=1 Tax=Methylobacillus sp. Pita1 TaxID=3382642 RepID=UPI0038B4B397